MMTKIISISDNVCVGAQCVGPITAAAVVPVVVGLLAVIITAVAWGFYCISECKDEFMIGNLMWNAHFRG